MPSVSTVLEAPSFSFTVLEEGINWVGKMENTVSEI